ncbi:flagellar hook-length control protein FliK [Nitrosospira briensis]|uniref:flagellar hook-length control protein FliK n=1 Tax=Nitrosospira briensis TaxID=35799 RepID=UPI0008F41300|nr:flagellar hook-length control protein FliK [Nitrosospira briensis]SFN71192.1 hook-length control protein FliK [Nitrosospira briensis]
MLTLPLLQNGASSPVSSIKNPASTANATDAAGPGAGKKAPGFSDVLEHEMKEKGDTSNAKPADVNPALSRTSGDPGMGAAREAEERAGETADGGAEIQKDNGEAAASTVVAIMASPSTALANIPGTRFTGYSRETAAGNRAGSAASNPAEAASDLAAESTQAGPAITSAQQVRGEALQAGLLAAPPGQTTGTEPVIAATDPVEIQPIPYAGPLSANILAGITGRMPTITGRTDTHPAIKDDTAIKPGLTSRAQVFSRLESGLPQSGLPEVKLAIDAERTSKFLAEGMHQSLPDAQVETAMIPLSPERGASSVISTAPAATPVYSAPGLEPRIGAPGWDNALGQKVLWMVSQQQQVAELSLNPPDLGPLQVVLSINGDQASAVFVSQQADVRQALEAALPRLKEMMADSGINLGNTTVSSDSPQQQREFERQAGPGARYGNGGDGVGGQGIDIGTAYIRSGGNGLVDTFA